MPRDRNDSSFIDDDDDSVSDIESVMSSKSNKPQPQAYNKPPFVQQLRQPQPPREPFRLDAAVAAKPEPKKPNVWNQLFSDAQAPAKPVVQGVEQYTYPKNDPGVEFAKVRRTVEKITQKVQKSKELASVQGDITNVIKTCVSITNDLMEMVKMYANAFESLSTEVQKLNDAIGAETSLENIRSLSDNTMKDAMMRFDTALKSLDRYLTSDSKKNLDEYRNEMNNVVKKSQNAVANAPV